MSDETPFHESRTGIARLAKPPGTPGEPGQGNVSVLAIVAHPDDEAIGPGGTLFALSRLSHARIFLIVAAAENPARREESQRAAAVLGIPSDHVHLLSFPDGALASRESDLRHELRQLADRVRPGLVITHKEDMHPDHGTLCRIVRQVFARGGTTVLHFQIPQPAVTPWQPTVFFRLPPEAVRAKLDELFPVYRTENWKDYFDPVVAEGTLRQAGHCSASPFAEAFECSQLSLAVNEHGLGLARPDDASPNSRPSLHFVGGDIGRVVLEACPCRCGSINVADQPHN